MFKMLSKLKVRLSTLNKEAWHARLAKYAFGPKYFYGTRKACSYWWLVVPASLVGAGVKMLFLAVVLLIMCIAWVLYIPFAAMAYFFGRRPSYWMLHKLAQDESAPAFYHYKVQPLPGATESYQVKRVRYAPWQIGLPLLGVAGIVAGVFIFSEEISDFLGDYYTWMLGAVGLVVAVCVLGYIYGRFVSPFLRRKWQEWCPDITWVEPEQVNQPDEPELANA